MDLSGTESLHRSSPAENWQSLRAGLRIRSPERPMAPARASVLLGPGRIGRTERVFAPRFPLRPELPMTDPDTISADYTLRPSELADTLAWHCHVNAVASARPVL